MEQKEIERLHKRGLLPDRYYYQLSNKPINVKLEEQHRKMIEELYQDKKVQEDIHNQLTAQVKEIFSNLFKDFKI